MEPWQLLFTAIGTTWNIQVKDVPPRLHKTELEAVILQRIEMFDARYSRFRTDSLVVTMSRQAGNYDLPPDAAPLLAIYEKLYRATDGLLTPLIGQVMDDAGYDAQYSLRAKKLQTPPAWDDVLSYDDHHLTLRQPALLDFGAAGKGYLIDIIGRLLSDAGSSAFVINAGGDILQCSQTRATMPVALENPMAGDEAIGVATIGNQSICGSAGSRRAWGEYHHIINPRTLQSPRHILAVWVVAADAMTADGLATALYFTEPAQLQPEFRFSYAILDSTMALQHSADFPAQFFEASA